MIAIDKHKCTIQFRCIAEINCNNSCISHITSLCQHVRNDFEHYMCLIVIHNKDILLQMIAYNNHNAQSIFFAMQKLIAVIIFHISYECAIMSEITNISLHGFNCNKLLRHFLP